MQDNEEAVSKGRWITTFEAVFFCTTSSSVSKTKFKSFLFDTSQEKGEGVRDLFINN